MRAAALLLVAMALGAAAPAVAEEPPPASGPLFALRGGAGWPWGKITRDGPAVRDYADWRASVGLEVGYRITPRYWTEVYFDLAPATAPHALCDAGAECSASDVRFGVAFLVRLLPGARIDPWVGLAAGMEVLRAKGSDARGHSVSWSWIGVEAPTVELGIDVQLADAISVGPWVSASAGRFTSGSDRVDGGDSHSERITRWAAHGWVSGGAKLTLKL
jgi:opacity protein-like surface antigen